MDATLPKAERLCGKTAVVSLFEAGKNASAGCLRCKYLQRADTEPSRIVVSVPKRSFKRAVKRNLLKRRMREAYRRQKELLGPGVDILFIYTSPEVQPYETVFSDMATLLQAVYAREIQHSENQKDI